MERPKSSKLLEINDDVHDAQPNFLSVMQKTVDKTTVN